MEHRRFFLELHRDAFISRPWSDDAITLDRMKEETESLCAFMWKRVGEGFWDDRCEWGLEKWKARLDDVRTHFFVAFGKSEPVGSFELYRHQDHVQLEGFGLLAPHRGKGLGHGLLTAAVDRALGLGVDLIRLDTATDDHPAALPLYLSQGFTVYKEDALPHPMS